MKFGFWLLLTMALLAVGLAVAAEEDDWTEVRRTDPSTMYYRWEVEIHLPELEDGDVDKKVRAWLEKSVADAVREVSGDACADPEFYTGGRWSLWGNAEVSQPSDSAVSVIFHLSQYTLGAAHPVNMVECLNYSLPGAEPLAFDDLFDNPSLAREIMAKHAPEIILASLRTDCPEAFADGDGVDFFTDGFAPEPDNYADVSLLPDAVVAHFQEYQVLQYVFGRPEAEIPLKLLMPAGPKASVWPALRK